MFRTNRWEDLPREVRDKICFSGRVMLGPNGINFRCATWKCVPHSHLELTGVVFDTSAKSQDGKEVVRPEMTYVDKYIYSHHWVWEIKPMATEERLDSF